MMRGVDATGVISSLVLLDLLTPKAECPIY
jgi:hypothetical protein